jgi:hypothetical protein
MTFPAAGEAERFYGGALFAVRVNAGETPALL